MYSSQTSKKYGIIEIIFKEIYCEKLKSNQLPINPFIPRDLIDKYLRPCVLDKGSLSIGGLRLLYAFYVSV